MISMDDVTFDSLVALRLPAPYPSDASAYADVLMIARRRQSAALRTVIVDGAGGVPVLARRINAALGDAAVSEASLRNMRAGTSAMPPRVAVALAGMMMLEPVEVLPHLEAFPWLGGRFRPAFAGRGWGEIARHFDVPLAVVAPELRSASAPASVVDVPVAPAPLGIADISRSIERRLGGRPQPMHDPVPQVRRPTSSPPGDDVMMSISDVPGGVRLTYRGLMSSERMDALREAAGVEAWSRPGAWSTSRVTGRTSPLFVCDMVVTRDRASRLLAAIGSPVRRRGLLARLFGRR